MKVYKNASINGKLCDFSVKDGKFESIGKLDCDGIDLQGHNVYAGLIDIHTHGCVGCDTMDADAFEKMSEYQAQNGVTSWYPTTMTMDRESLMRVNSADLSSVKGAQILGFHFEGPYIAREFKGAQNEKYLRNPDIDEFSEYSNAKLVTLAPELPGSVDFIKKCGAVVCLGHTAADFDCALNAFENGAKCLTHTFNAMPPLHHRKPGVIGAAIDKNAYVQVICDGFHIHKSVITALYRIFGSDRMVLISDSMRATGMPDGIYEFGGQKITVTDGVARTESGAIAGSTTNLLGCVKKAIEFGIPSCDAFKMASETPARLMGINKGRIVKGFDADFIVTDEKYNVLKTAIAGEEV